MTKLTCFKAYDIRGRLGGDVRLTSEALKLALAKGLQDAGVDVLDIGMSGTEEIYFA
ncbi:hypothetical protein DUQ69_14000, partial [Salmonella enterica subsp. enterica serovar Infantis]|nr:hypothetical protein [Salmonella enterica subsp. enterica serovar Infantis]ECI8075888.1 hypothetical protein [Salmonella enterica subsp. enterica serovar Infantis]EHM1903210.1 phosphomannomutase CpsG [Salmonella enterica subsp. enterica serovar Infantis]